MPHMSTRTCHKSTTELFGSFSCCCSATNIRHKTAASFWNGMEAQRHRMLFSNNICAYAMLRPRFE